MYEHVIAWIGLALLLLLCLPIPAIQKLVLRIYGLALRLALLALLGAAAYLWFRPEQLPVEVTDTLSNFPLVMALLPEPGTQLFGISAAAVVVALLLPLLAVLDVCGKPADVRPGHLRVLGAEPGAEERLRPAPAQQRGPVPAPRRIDRRGAADAMAEAAPRLHGSGSFPLDQEHSGATHESPPSRR
jgi:hypothetical protein